MQHTSNGFCNITFSSPSGKKNIPPKLTYSARTGWNEPVPREDHKSHVMED